MRPLPGKVAPPVPLPPPAPVEAGAKPAGGSVPAPLRRVSVTPARRPAPVAGATLDGSWDRRLRQGDITPDRVIDLHGHTLGAAHAVLADALQSASGRGDRIILIVTGKGSSARPGRIRAELSHWLDSEPLRGGIAALRPAHPRHGGSGAFYLILRRRA